MPRWMIPIVVALPLSWSSGCSSAVPSESASSAAGIEESHGIPPHKPKSLSDAVDELLPRLTHLVAEDPAPPAAVRVVQFQELHDVIRWIPELAAQSDLPKQDWDEVRWMADELEQVFRRFEPPAQPSRRDRKEFQQYVLRLRPYAERTRPVEIHTSAADAPDLEQE